MKTTTRLTLTALICTLALAGVAATRSHDKAGPPHNAPPCDVSGEFLLALADLDDDPGHDGPPPHREGWGHRWRDRRDRHDDNAPAEKLTDEQVQVVLSVLKDRRPELGDRLEAWWHKSPDRVREMLARKGDRLRRLTDLKERDPKLYDLRLRDARLSQQSHDLAQRITHAGEDPKTDALRKKLRTLLGEHFQVRHEIRERRLERLQEKIADSRNEIDARREMKGELIEARYNDLVKDPDRLGW